MYKDDNSLAWISGRIWGILSNREESSHIIRFTRSTQPKPPWIVCTLVSIQRWLARLSFLPFPTVHGILQARILEWVAITSSLSMTNLDSILKSRNITLLTKVCIFKAKVFSNSHITFIKRLFSSSSLSYVWDLRASEIARARQR